MSSTVGPADAPGLPPIRHNHASASASDRAFSIILSCVGLGFAFTFTFTFASPARALLATNRSWMLVNSLASSVSASLARTGFRST